MGLGFVALLGSAFLFGTRVGSCCQVIVNTEVSTKARIETMDW